jgi:RimJ/RimL family protein N-acetyltransferase
VEYRRATFDDVGAILDILEKHHETSNVSNVKFVRPDCLKIVQHFIADWQYFAEVAVHNGEVCGALFGSIEPHFINSKKGWATDLFFISNGGGPGLLRRFKEWAFANNAERIVMGISSGNNRADKFIELSGFEKTGGMYVIRS